MNPRRIIIESAAPLGFMEQFDVAGSPFIHQRLVICYPSCFISVPIERGGPGEGQTSGGWKDGRRDEDRRKGRRGCSRA